MLNIRVGEVHFFVPLIQKAGPARLKQLKYDNFKINMRLLF